MVKAKNSLDISNKQALPLLSNWNFLLKYPRLIYILRLYIHYVLLLTIIITIYERKISKTINIYMVKKNILWIFFMRPLDVKKSITGLQKFIAILSSID